MALLRKSGQEVDNERQPGIPGDNFRFCFQWNGSPETAVQIYSELRFDGAADSSGLTAETVVGKVVALL